MRQRFLQSKSNFFYQIEKVELETKCVFQQPFVCAWNSSQSGRNKAGSSSTIIVESETLGTCVALRIVVGAKNTNM